MLYFQHMKINPLIFFFTSPVFKMYSSVHHLDSFFLQMLFRIFAVLHNLFEIKCLQIRPGQTTIVRNFLLTFYRNSLKLKLLLCFSLCSVLLKAKNINSVPAATQFTSLPLLCVFKHLPYLTIVGMSG